MLFDFSDLEEMLACKKAEAQQKDREDYEQALAKYNQFVWLHNTVHKIRNAYISFGVKFPGTDRAQAYLCGLLFDCPFDLDRETSVQQMVDYGYINPLYLKGWTEHYEHILNQIKEQTYEHKKTRDKI